MFLRTFFTRLVELVFVLDGPRDFVVKLTVLYVVTNGVMLYVDYLFLGLDYPMLSARVGIRTLVSVPLIAAVCGIVTFLYGQQTRLTQLALTDPLTGLPNRRDFLDRTKASFVQGESGYLLLIDADHFKMINDTHGHPAGDACLVALAERLRDTCAPDDVLGRLGGEEFVVYLPDGDRSRLVRIGKRLTRALLVTHPEGDTPIRLTVSIGATDTSPLEPVETALQRADIALYQAKKNGRARMIVGPRSYSGWAA